MRFYRSILLLVCVALFHRDALAQENTSWRNGITVDFSAGIPFYMGDFDHLWNMDQQFNRLTLGPRSQYNATAFAFGMNFPLSSVFDVRLRFSHSTLFYTENSVRVNFKNALFDAGALLQTNLINQRFGWYITTGLGANNHFDAQIFRSLAEMESEPNFDRKWSFSTTFGTGVQFSITPEISVFTEAEWLFTGSDRIDGYFGDHPDLPGAQVEDPKSYFQRDQIISARAGVRYTFQRGARKVEERPFDDLISSYVPDPFGERRPPPEPVEVDDRPEEWIRLGILRSLDGITIAVEYAQNLTQLERQKMVAERIAAQLHGNVDVRVYLLAEPQGFTVHFGNFRTVAEARQYVPQILHYYSGAQVLRH